MMAIFRKMLGLENKVGLLDSAQEARALATRRATAELTQEIMKLERRGWEVRQALAANTLALVVGDQHNEADHR